MDFSSPPEPVCQSPPEAPVEEGLSILIAEDHYTSRRALEVHLKQWGYQVISTTTGLEAWEVFQKGTPPRLAILDWMMPGMDGLELCRRIRSLNTQEPPYLILLTARSGREDVVVGLESGADDYLTKPVDREELKARLQAGRRIVELQRHLSQRVLELERALQKVNQLQGLLPICCYCKKIRADQDYWQQVEAYISDHSDVRFSHGICPECYARVINPQMDVGPS